MASAGENRWVHAEGFLLGAHPHSIMSLPALGSPLHGQTTRPLHPEAKATPILTVARGYRLTRGDVPAVKRGRTSRHGPAVVPRQGTACADASEHQASPNFERRTART